MSSSPEILELGERLAGGIQAVRAMPHVERFTDLTLRSQGAGVEQLQELSEDLGTLSVFNPDYIARTETYPRLLIVEDTVKMIVATSVVSTADKVELVDRWAEESSSLTSRIFQSRAIANAYAKHVFKVMRFRYPQESVVLARAFRDSHSITGFVLRHM